MSFQLYSLYVTLLNPGYTNFVYILGQSPCDWRTTMHQNVVKLFSTHIIYVLLFSNCVEKVLTSRKTMVQICPIVFYSSRPSPAIGEQQYIALLLVQTNRTMAIRNRQAANTIQWSVSQAICFSGVESFFIAIILSLILCPLVYETSHASLKGRYK